MDIPIPAQIVEGDHLRWRFPNSGLGDECTVVKVTKTTSEGVSVYTDFTKRKDGPVVGTYLRHIKMDWLTHYNRRRLATGSRQVEEKRVRSGNEAEAEQIRF